MPAEDDVAELLTRAKTGDQAAVAEFLTRFENEVRMMIRARLPKKLRHSVRLHRFCAGRLAELFHASEAQPAGFREHRTSAGILVRCGSQ